MDQTQTSRRDFGFPMAVGLLGKASSSSVAEFNANPPAGDRAAEIVIGSIPVPTRCEEARISEVRKQ